MVDAGRVGAELDGPRSVRRRRPWRSWPPLSRTRWAALVGALVATFLLGACSDADGSAGSDATSTASTAVDQDTHAVGSRSSIHVDPTRPTPRSGEVPSRAERTLETTVYYPAEGEPGGPVSPDAAPAGDGSPFPLLVFSHGLGATGQVYAELLEVWASAGFVVVAPDFPLSRADAPAGPDAGDVGNQPGDVSFLVDVYTDLPADDPLAGVVDTERIGAAGHSNGAITTLGLVANSCCRDERIDAAVVLAGTPNEFAGGEYEFPDAPPVMVVHGTADDLLPYAEAVRVFNQLEGPKGLVTVVEGTHGTYLRPRADADADGSFAAVASLTGDFWAAFLRDDPAARARLAVGAAPEGIEVVVALEPGSTVTVPTTAPPALDRRAAADPTTGLRNGDLVTVRWSGFTPGAVVNVVQCSQGGTGGNDVCDLTKGQILVPDPTGEGSLELEIIAGPVGSGRCDSGTADCVIVVNDAGLQDEAATIRIPLDFAP